MIELIAAAAFLLATHYGISSTELRPWLVARIGERAYLGVYSVIAFGAIGWVISAFVRAPYIELWPTGAWSAGVALLVMPFALLLAVSGVSTPNPTAVGAPPETLEQVKAVRGILRVTRHPLMWGIALWALVHLVANGDLASFVMFGVLAALALVGTLMIDRKYAARRGAEWQRFVGASSNLPLAAIVQGRQSLMLAEIGWARVAVALLLYAVLLALHPWLFGVSPFAAM
jgi:uncharacterized membrane protein